MASLEIAAIANISVATSLDLPLSYYAIYAIYLILGVIMLFISYFRHALGWEEVSLQPVAKFQQAR